MASELQHDCASLEIPDQFQVLEEISATEDLSRSASGGQLLVGVSGRAGVPFRVPAWAVCG